jgi:hypothetical protein
VACLVQDLVGRFSGEALIPHVDGQTAELAELRSKGLGTRRARAFFSGNMQRIADNDACDGEAAGKTRQGSKVFTRIVAAFEREHGLRSEAQLV